MAVPHHSCWADGAPGSRVDSGCKLIHSLDFPSGYGDFTNQNGGRDNGQWEFVATDFLQDI